MVACLGHDLLSLQKSDMLHVFLFISAPLGKFPVAELLFVRVNDMLR